MNKLNCISFKDNSQGQVMIGLINLTMTNLGTDCATHYRTEVNSESYRRRYDGLKKM
jgi:hypothetical protein